MKLFVKVFASAVLLVGVARWCGAEAIPFSASALVPWSGGDTLYTNLTLDTLTVLFDGIGGLISISDCAAWPEGTCCGCWLDACGVVAVFSERCCVGLGQKWPDGWGELRARIDQGGPTWSPGCNNVAQTILPGQSIFVGVNDCDNCYWDNGGSFTGTLVVMAPGGSPMILVDTPNGGETWMTGGVHAIVWAMFGNGEGGLSVEVNRDYPGPTWEILSQDTSLTNYYEWVVNEPSTNHARVRVMSVNQPTVGDTSDGDFTIRSCASPFEIIGPLSQEIYYSPGDTANVSVMTRNTCYATTAVRLRVETRSQGVPGFDGYTLVGEMQYDLAQGWTPYSTEFTWTVPFLAFPTQVGVRATLIRASNSLDTLAQQWFPDVYTVSLLPHDQWQGTLDLIENCAPAGFDCASGLSGALLERVVPYVSEGSEVASFVNSMCVTRRQWDRGDWFGAGLTFVDGVAGGFTFGVEILTGLPTNAVYQGLRIAADCGMDAIDFNWSSPVRDGQTDPSIIASALVENSDSLSAFSNQLITQGSGVLSIMVGDSEVSNFDRLSIADGFVFALPSHALQWAYLGDRATPAGDSTATNLLHCCQFLYATDSTEATNVSMVHRLLDSVVVQLNWDSLQIDSGGGFRIQASDTMSCIFLELDANGDGVYEQSLPPFPNPFGLACFGEDTSGYSQSINTAEYFFDSDPGQGSGTSLPITEGNDVINTDSISVEGLPTGPHDLFVRHRTNNGKWSLPLQQRFWVVGTAPPQTNFIAGGELFFDTDPGVGNGCLFSQTDTLNESGMVDSLLTYASVASLPIGPHAVYARLRDVGGHWSNVIRDSILVALPTEIHLTVYPDSTSGSVYLSWTPFENASLYSVQYDSVSTGTFANSVSVFAPDTSVTINLFAGNPARQFFRVTAITSSACSQSASLGGEQKPSSPTQPLPR